MRGKETTNIPAQRNVGELTPYELATIEQYQNRNRGWVDREEDIELENEYYTED